MRSSRTLVSVDYRLILIASVPFRIQCHDVVFGPTARDNGT